MEKALEEEEKSHTSDYLNTELATRLVQVLGKELLEYKETVGHTYIHSSSCLMRTYLQELLEKEGSGLKVLLLNNMHSDISRMFRLFSRIKGMHTMLTDIQTFSSNIRLRY